MIHYSFVGYMIATAIILFICVMAYRILMENKVKPSTNRLILLSIYAISFIVPLLSALIPESNSESGIEIGKPEFADIAGNVIEKYEMKTLTYPKMFLWISTFYFLGLFLTFFYSLLSVGFLIFMLRKSKRRIIGNNEILIHDNRMLSSFSWYNKIFLYKESLSYDNSKIQILITHEEAHQEMGHWIDLALAQLVLIFQWFNPYAWFMKRELQRIHEYEADEAVLQSGIDEKEYQMFLIQNISRNRYSGLTDGLNNCSLKNRIIMMKKTKFKKDWVTRGIVVCGFAILGGFIIHIPAVANALENKPQSINAFQTPAAKSVAESSSGGYDENSAKALNDLVVNGKKTKGSDKGKGELENYPDAYLSVDKEAEYEGGESQLLRDLSISVRYPQEAQENNIQGRVVVRFKINTNGSISNCEVASSQNPIFNEPALNAVESLPGKWKPAEIDGKPVASIYNIPLTFKLQ